jgi:hypothetical protein
MSLPLIRAGLLPDDLPDVMRGQEQHDDDGGRQ